MVVGVQARPRPAGRRRRRTRRGAGAVPVGADRVLRDASARTGVVVPLPRRRARPRGGGPARARRAPRSCPWPVRSPMPSRPRPMYGRGRDRSVSPFPTGAGSAPRCGRRSGANGGDRSAAACVSPPPTLCTSWGCRESAWHDGRRRSPRISIRPGPPYWMTGVVVTLTGRSPLDGFARSRQVVPRKARFLAQAHRTEQLVVAGDPVDEAETERARRRSRRGRIVPPSSDDGGPGSPARHRTPQPRPRLRRGTRCNLGARTRAARCGACAPARGTARHGR